MSTPQLEEHFETPEDEIKALKHKVAQLESNREKLLDSLRIKKAKDGVHNVHLSVDSLKEFFHLGKCDQKLLAILYWDKLTREQKEVFTDHEEMELEQEYERKMHEIMTDPTKMRTHFLRGAAPILDDMLKLAKGEKVGTSDNFAFREVWEVLRDMINKANSPVPMLDLKGKEISDQIDTILTKVSAGEISFIEAKEYMSLVSSGFNLQELPKLMAKLEMLESQ
jgi:hypothetical protein